jgi:hypothetical protein
MADELAFKASSSGGYVAGARPLLPRHVETCRVVHCREALLDVVPKGGAVAEIGVEAGYFARTIVQRCKPREYHGFDLCTSQVRFDLFPTLKAQHIHFHNGPSAAMLAEFPDAFFDMIYVDGDHSYRGALSDAQVAVTKLAPNGLLVFNDYLTWSPLDRTEYGVMRVVSKLCHEHDFVFAAMALHPVGYHDVALKRSAGTGVTSAT